MVVQQPRSSGHGTLYYGTTSEQLGAHTNGSGVLMTDDPSVAIKTALRAAEQDKSKPILVIGRGLEGVLEGHGVDEATRVRVRSISGLEQVELDPSRGGYLMQLPIDKLY